jgi:16S rRNA G527 N7-methylase RsmG
MKLKCLFSGHIPVTKERVKEINKLLSDYGYDIIGSDAFSNMKAMKELRKELVSCSRCGKQL